MAKKSAGILLFRRTNGSPEVLLVHPGGPFWKNKDIGAWSVPKGEFDDDEKPLSAAIREVREELGIDVAGDFIELLPQKQKSGKVIYSWALEQDTDADAIVSNTFELEWPPRSGKMIEIPEVDRADWLSLDEAKIKIIPGQVPIIENLEKILSES
ncbi:NUDIX domain-containing protein [Flavihumibacter sp. R14]|nr:NUDIX domain-containing protein [Flavihumibacter soli]